MAKKLQCILLVDDDRATNYVHQIIINRINCAEKTIIKRNGLEAIDFLKSEKEKDCPLPDLILLDINMPKMNGWEFLDEYEKIKPPTEGPVIIAMLTSSLNPDDYAKAQAMNIKSFKNKPLTTEAMRQIVDENF